MVSSGFAMPSADQMIVQLADVKKSLAGRMVLDVSALTVYRSECVVIQGENGAGKSTLLKVLAGLVPPDSGVFSICGKPMSWRRAVQAIGKSVVYLHQIPYLFDRTVAENVAYGLALRGLHKNQICEQVELALQWAGLSALAHRNARDLSGGERQRVALTRARILKPLLLLLDEPTTAMDPTAKDQTFELIQNLAKDGHAIYIATHESAESYVPDRIVNMKAGQIC